MKDVWKCVFTGVLCLWLFADIIHIKMPVVKIEKSILNEWEEKTDGAVLEEEEFDWEDIRQDFHICWFAKGCILFLFLSVMKRAE